MIWLILGGLWLIGMAWLSWELYHAPERPDWDPEYWVLMRAIYRRLFPLWFYWPQWAYVVRTRPDGRTTLQKVRCRA